MVYACLIVLAILVGVTLYLGQRPIDYSAPKQNHIDIVASRPDDELDDTGTVEIVYEEVDNSSRFDKIRY